MRLLNTTTLKLESFFDHRRPRYAILSHTWGSEEVTFQDIQQIYTARRLAGFGKVQKCCEVARGLGYEWAWIDTCCIDKSSSSELSEAINSMYSWYRGAAVCLTYLEDVPSAQLLSSGDVSSDTYWLAFANSRWFTRGWTLQELVASRQIEFYAEDWTIIGTKKTLVDRLGEITSIDTWYLNFPERAENNSYVSVAQIMSWASKRETTRAEDMAYCLMGMFDINMPLLYGEGYQKAFLRLQGEILKVSTDSTLFAWTASEEIYPDPALGEEYDESYEGLGDLLAYSSREFAGCETITSSYDDLFDKHPYEMTNMGLRITLPLIYTETDGYIAIFDFSTPGPDTPLGAMYSGIHMNEERGREKKIFTREILEKPVRMEVQLQDEHVWARIQGMEWKEVAMRTVYIKPGREIGIRREHQPTR
jgi:hypothetical protein